MAASDTTAEVLPDGPVRATVDFPSRDHLLLLAGEKENGKTEQECVSIIEKLILSQFGFTSVGLSGGNTLFAPHGTSIEVKVYAPSP